MSPNDAPARVGQGLRQFRRGLTCPLGIHGQVKSTVAVVFHKPTSARHFKHEKIVVTIVVVVCPKKGFRLVFNDPGQGDHLKALATKVPPCANSPAGASKGQIRPSVVVPIGQRDGGSEMAIPIVLGDVISFRCIDENLTPGRVESGSENHNHQAQMDLKPPHGDNLGIQLDSQVFLGQRFMNRCELFVRARFDGALAFKVDNHGTLLCLQWVVATRVNQAFNHVIKCVVMVVEQHHGPVPVEGHFRQHVFLGFDGTGGDEAVQIVSLWWCKDRRSYRLSVCLCPCGASIEL